MAEVRAARDLRLHRTVAIKLVDARTAPDPAVRRRFVREARAAASFSHPNAVAVFDAGDADGYLYLVMELVEGRSLADRIAATGRCPSTRRSTSSTTCCRRSAPPTTPASSTATSSRATSCDPRRHGQARRLRHRQADRRWRPHAGRPVHRHAGVPVARAGQRRAGHARHRPVRRRGRPLRGDRRPASVRRRLTARHRPGAPRPGAARPPLATTRRARPRRRRRRPGDGEGSGQQVLVRRGDAFRARPVAPRRWWPRRPS